MELSHDPAAGPRPAPAPSRRRGPVLWAVASGKGGVGKSVLSSSLAIGLSQSGPRAIAVDLDLGGANLHNLFGCERARYTVADVLRGAVRSDQALAATTVPGVRLLSGARGSLDAANPNYAQKQKLLRGLRQLDAGHVVIDLGAGSGFNTLDAFLAADRRLLVVTPEKTAVENAYHFLKAAFFRSLRAVAHEPDVRRALGEVLDEARQRGASPRELVEAASRVDSAVGARLRAAMRGFEVELVVNRVEPGGRDPGPELALACRAQLGAVLHHAASLPDDSSVPDAVAREVPVMQLFPGLGFCTGVVELVGRLLHGAPHAELHAPRAGSARSGAAPPARSEPPPLPVFDGESPGRYLRICRELQRLSLAELCERTRIRHLPNIEAERFDVLPPDAYLRDFVRQYAKLLGIVDPARIAARYIERAEQHRDQRSAGPRSALARLFRRPAQRWQTMPAPAARPTLPVATPTEPLREDAEVDRLVANVLAKL